MRRLPPDVPARDALPPTVNVRPPRPAKVPDVPLVRVKFPLVDRFWPLRLRAPADWV